MPPRVVRTATLRRAAAEANGSGIRVLDTVGVPLRKKSSAMPCTGQRLEPRTGRQKADTAYRILFRWLAACRPPP